MTRKNKDLIGDAEVVTSDFDVQADLPDAMNNPVPGAPNATPSGTVVGYTNTPTPAELAIAFPGVAHPTGRVWYNPDGTVKRPDQQVAEEDLGPEHMPPVTAEDAPFSTSDIPSGWNRHPTQAEVDYLNAKYPVDGYVPPPPDTSGTFTAFSQSNPTVATADLEDTDALDEGFLVTLMAISGTPEGIAAIDGVNAVVLSTTGGGVTLGLDLADVDTTGLEADYVWEAPA